MTQLSDREHSFILLNCVIDHARHIIHSLHSPQEPNGREMMMSQKILIIIKLGVFAGIILLCALFVLKFKRVRQISGQMEPEQEITACNKACR